MKSTGIVRRIDALGRIVIPMEIRKTARMHTGDALEIYTGNNAELIFKKYSHLHELGDVCAQYAELLYQTGKLPVMVCDRDQVVAVSGFSPKKLLGQRVSPALEDVMAARRKIVFGQDEPRKVPIIDSDRYFILVGEPIVADGELCGYIMFVADKVGTEVGTLETKLIELTAGILGKQMEE